MVILSEKLLADYVRYNDSHILFIHGYSERDNFVMKLFSRSSGGRGGWPLKVCFTSALLLGGQLCEAIDLNLDNTGMSGILGIYVRPADGLALEMAL